MLRKTLLAILLIFIVVSILRSPDLAASYVHQGIDVIILGLQRIGEFFNGILTPQ